MLIDVLPTVHALAGRDTTNKIVTKTASLNLALKDGYELLYLFEKVELIDGKRTDAERFLLRCI